MGRYNETDIKITPDGDFAIEAGDFALVDNVEAVAQGAYCRLMSADPEWYMENISANLEDLLGKPNTKETAENGENLIREALMKDDLINYEDIYVQAVPIGKFELKFYVFFKPDEYGEDPIGFEVDVNLSAGATVRRVK